MDQAFTLLVTEPSGTTERRKDRTEREGAAVDRTEREGAAVRSESGAVFAVDRTEREWTERSESGQNGARVVLYSPKGQNGARVDIQSGSPNTTTS